MGGGGAEWRKVGERRESLNLPSGLRLWKSRIESPRLRGRRLLFISDLHTRGSATLCLPGAGRPSLKWRGLEWIEQSLPEACDTVNPDWIVFGGDLVVHSCWLDNAMRTLAGLKAKEGKFAVYGNWDRRRRRWLPLKVWEGLYRDAGFTVLANSSAETCGLRLYGLDDFKTGVPSYRPPSGAGKAFFNCVVSHNPDAVAELGTDALSGVDLALCGHTHGGQIRIPLFGAFKTSSRHWKLFERGELAHSGGRARMLVCAGIGTTFINLRANCPPEALWVEFS